MTRRFLVSVGVSLLLLGLLAGCANRCRQPFTATCPNRCAPPCAGAPGLPPPGAIPGAPVPVGVVPPAPPPGAGVPPPGPPPGVGVPPPGASPLYPGAPGASLSPPPAPAPSGPDTRFSSPAPQADAWKPAPEQAGVRLSGPEADVRESRENVRLQPPTAEPPVASAKPPVIEQRIPPAASPSLPVGIPEFAVIVPEKVIAGQKPAQEAFDWLKNNHFRTVLHLRKPGEPDGARAEVERRGLKYETIDVSGQGLAEAMEKFNRIVGAADLQPLFVYDQDGTLAGPLWYLRFRIVDRQLDVEAKRKATVLGLRDDGTGDTITLLVAMQEYLRKNGK